MFTEGSTFDNTYRIMSKIGSGGTGDVYLAYHMRLEKYVVIKKIKDNFAGSINVRAEVDILKRLKHSYLPQVYDFLQYGTTVYTVMDYIEGNDLERYIRAGYVVDETTLIKWLRQLCEVLVYLHSQTPPIIHSDIKPGNIMITKDGNVCLIDFNISLDGDDSSQISGISLPYASPEQYGKAKLFMNRMEHRGIVLDGRSDMYSLAASFYHLMTGVPPANPDTYTTPVSSYDIPYSDGILYVIEKAMNYDVYSRFEDMNHMLKAVNSIYKHTRTYRMYIAGLIISAALYVAVMGAGIWCVVRGFGMINRENYKSDVENLMQSYESYMYDEAIDEGIDILNNSEYVHSMDSHPEEKIELLHIVGECYFENGQYEYALEYYKDAVELMTDIKEYSSYYRDYIVTMVKCGHIDEAEKETADSKKMGVSDSDISIINAEILIYNKEYDKAFKDIDSLLKQNISEQSKVHLMVTGSEAAEKSGDYKREIDYLEDARDINDTVSIIRKLGNAYMLIVNKDEAKGNRDKYIKNALACYKTITGKKYYSFNDSLNLAICYRALGKYADSIKVLNGIKESHDDYRVYMHLAFAYDGKGDKKKASENIKKAVSKYEKTPEGDREDTGSDNIQNMYELQKKYR